MAYKENLLQWIWQELQFNCRGLQTSCGKKIQIYDNGRLNGGAGPDFLGAHLRIGGLDWHGSVEVHNSAKEWYHHGHHLDRNYNNVVLHVVGSRADVQPVDTEAGSQPFTLCLQPYLSNKLYKLLRDSKRRSIPCAGNADFIHQQAFEIQVERAHKEYLEYKVEELIRYYPAGVPISAAWMQAYVHQVYRTFGISANRDQMGCLAERVGTEDCRSYSLAGWQEEVQFRAFDTKKAEDRISWIDTGLRPASRPKARVKQAAAFQHASAKLDLSEYLRGPFYAWEAIDHQIDPDSRAGKTMGNLVYYTAFIPALYFLGELLHDRTLQKTCYQIWSGQSSFVPAKIQSAFKRAGFEVNSKVNKLGLAHHYKRYCSEKNCRECKVFKNAIRA